MAVMLADRMVEKPSNVLKRARDKYLKTNPMSMEEIDRENEGAIGIPKRF